MRNTSGNGSSLSLLDEAAETATAVALAVAVDADAEAAGAFEAAEAFETNKDACQSGSSSSKAGSWLVVSRGRFRCGGGG